MAEHDQLFASKQEWVNKGQSWLTRHPMWGDYFKAICFDATGRYVGNGGDFRRAEDEGAFPVRWLWPDQVGQMAILNAELLAALKGLYELMDDGDGLSAADPEESAIAYARSIIEKAEGRP